jgi:pimeloyl-[acyl-carrier protein] methyl ester esterase
MTVQVRTCGRGEPIVALHGWGLPGDVWSPMATTNSQRWRMSMPDLPGYGGSRDVVCDHSLSSLAREIALSIPEPAIWMGWSMGGMIALEAAATYPEQVRALVLVASSPRFVKEAAWPHGVDAEVLDQFATQLESDHRATLLRFLVLQAGRQEGARQVIKQLKTLLASQPEPDPAALRGGLHLLRDSDLRSRGEDIRCPTLAILGERDTLVPASLGAQLARLQPAWRIARIPRASHAPFLSHARQFTELLEAFVDDVV